MMQQPQAVQQQQQYAPATITAAANEFTIVQPQVQGAMPKFRPSRKVFIAQLFDGCSRFQEQCRNATFDEEGVPSVPKAPFNRVSIQGVIRKVEAIELSCSDAGDGVLDVDEQNSFYILWVDDGTQIIRCVSHCANAGQVLGEDMFCDVNSDISAPEAVAWFLDPVRNRDAQVLTTLSIPWEVEELAIGTYVSMDGLFFAVSPVVCAGHRSQAGAEEDSVLTPCVLYWRVSCLDQNRTTPADGGGGDVAKMEAAWNIEVMAQLKELGL